MALNALLKRQSEIKKAIEELEPKFKKVSEANRKVAYFEKRLTELKAFSDEFNENDAAIADNEEMSAERKVYNDGNVYDVVTEMMEKMKTIYEKPLRKSSRTILRMKNTTETEKRDCFRTKN